MHSDTHFYQLKYTALQQFWGYSSFRPLQQEAIDSISSGIDTLVLFPTGAGKSLCYQLPALILEGLCLVVSPLLALMRDQVLQLQTKGIEADYLSSEMEETELQLVYERCEEGLTKVLYISPERLSNREFLEKCPLFDISFLAVDEAHCISEWGQDFRPSYQFIKRFRADYKHVPCIALTATATPKVLSEIVEKLELRQPNIFKKSFERENLHLNIEQISDKYSYISEFLKYHQEPGIIYARTRKDTEDLCTYLKSLGFNNVDFYHAGLKAKEKSQKQQKWLLSNQEVLISTNAFGMGIDKENVRFVIHLSPPSSIENYYQEIGRAGRDQKESYALLLWNHHELQNIKEILKNQIPNKKEFMDIVTYLYSLFQIADHDLSDGLHEFNISRIKNLTKLSIPKIRTVLNFLHHQEIIYYNQLKSASSIELKFPFEYYEILPASDSYFVELLLRSLPGISENRVRFNEAQVASKIGISTEVLKHRILELRAKDYLEYLDGSLAKIKFLIPRNDKVLEGQWWNLFLKIQKNKLQKWEEMKFFLKEDTICKMKMILTYFGEKTSKNCMHCNVCINKEDHFFGTGLSQQILQILQQHPATLEELFVKLSFHKKEKIRETLILQLDCGQVKMLNFKTYTVGNIPEKM